MQISVGDIMGITDERLKEALGKLALDLDLVHKRFELEKAARSRVIALIRQMNVLSKHLSNEDTREIVERNLNVLKQIVADLKAVDNRDQGAYERFIYKFEELENSAEEVIAHSKQITALTKISKKEA